MGRIRPDGDRTVSSFILAGAFGLVSLSGARTGFGAIAEVAGLLGWINLALGVFNLLPGAPLDGGRILRSAVWAVTKDRKKAVHAAARTGQVLGYFIVALGVLQLILVTTGLIGGLWLIIIGWFLAMAAQSEVMQQELRDQLRGLTMGDLLQQRELPAIDSGTDLQTASERLRRQSEDALAVRRGGRITGVVLLGDIAQVAPEERAHRTVGEIAVPVEELPSVRARTDVVAALGELRRRRPIVVTSTAEDERTDGIVTPEQLQRLVTRSLQLGGHVDVDPDPPARVPDHRHPEPPPRS